MAQAMNQSSGHPLNNQFTHRGRWNGKSVYVWYTSSHSLRRILPKIIIYPLNPRHSSLVQSRGALCAIVPCLLLSRRGQLATYAYLYSALVL